jgi:hypothetical protein
LAFVGRHDRCVLTADTFFTARKGKLERPDHEGEIGQTQQLKNPEWGQPRGIRQASLQRNPRRRRGQPVIKPVTGSQRSCRLKLPLAQSGESRVRWRHRACPARHTF